MISYGVVKPQGFKLDPVFNQVQCLHMYVVKWCSTCVHVYGTVEAAVMSEGVWGFESVEQDKGRREMYLLAVETSELDRNKLPLD